MAKQECESARQAVEPFGGRAQRLREVADLIVQRTK